MKSSSATAKRESKGEASANTNMRVTNLKDLGGVVQAPKVLKIDLNTPGATERPYPVLEFTMRALTDAEWSESGRIYREALGVPPLKADQSFDENDPAYVAKRLRAVMLQRVFCFTKALVDMEFPGATLDEKLKAVEDAMPPRLMDALWGAIHSTTADSIGMASFT